MNADFKYDKLTPMLRHYVDVKKKLWGFSITL